MSHESKIGEATASLTARLTDLGIDEPAATAHEFIQDMLRNGWRPAARAIEPTPTEGLGQRATDPAAHARTAREALQAARHRKPHQ